MAANKKNKIEIKPENKGTFTNYCKNKGYTGVTQACINQGKKSKNPTTRKRSVFADNSRKWN